MTLIKTIIVDDEARIRRGIERMVRSCGEEWEIVGTFSDGKEVYDTVLNENIKFDVLISDVRMPEMDGLTLQKELNQHFSFLTVFISGYDDFEYLQTAIQEGAVNYLLKPIDREQFYVQLNKVKQKVITRKIREQEWLEMREKANMLEYAKQIQRLSEWTWKEENDISFFNWTKQFPAGKYQLLYVSIDQALSKTHGLTTEEWNTAILTVEEKLEAVLDYHFHNSYANKWWWRGNPNCYWILLHQDYGEGEKAIPEAAIEDLALELKTAIQKQTPFTLSISLGDEFSDLSLFVEMKKQLVSIATSKKRHQLSIQVAKEWIQKNLHESITIKKIAQQVYMNPTYFCDYFKAQTGETILDYVTTARLEKAKELLGNTDLKIYDISAHVGYQDTKYFSKLFKQWMGQTPSQFREEHSVSSYIVS